VRLIEIARVLNRDRQVLRDRCSGWSEPKSPVCEDGATIAMRYRLEVLNFLLAGVRHGLGQDDETDVKRLSLKGDACARDLAVQRGASILKRCD
jgi:hypothetical protein